MRSARKGCEADMGDSKKTSEVNRTRRESVPLVWVVVAIIALAVAAVAQEATPLTLADAAKMTLANNPMHKAALADTKATSAGVREARAPMLPRIMFAENFTGGNDPVFVFGAKLRQQEFTAADFALNSLNRPTPFGNYASRFSGQWNLFDSTQSWKALDRAKFMNVAAEQQLNRTDQELVFQTVQAFYGVLLAQKQVQVAEDAVKTVEAIEQQSRARVESGMAVDSDLLSAQVQHSARQQELIERRNQLALAQTRLALAMGAGSDAVYQPKEALEERAFPAADVNQLEKTATGEASRPEAFGGGAQRAGQERVDGQGGVRSAAEWVWVVGRGLPRCGMDGSEQLGGGRGVAVRFVLRWREAGALAREKALQERAAAGHAGFQDAVRLEVRQAYYQFDAAQQQVKVARSAIAQADESLRINQNRYESGLSTVTDMLRVEEAAHRAKADYWQAVYRMNASYAGVELATGTLAVDSPAVTQ